MTNIFKRLATIAKAVKGKVQLVLHGTTGDAEVEESIKYGMTKINLNRELEIWNAYMEKKTKVLPITSLMDEGIAVMQKEIERLCDVCQSSGRAE
jgi:fructose/tagatose bisphosphate aldolase